MSDYTPRMKTKSETSILDTIAAVKAGRAARGAAPLPKSGWRTVAGTVPDDALSREAARLGDEWRKAANTRR